jgi:hypothetical protein
MTAHPDPNPMTDEQTKAGAVLPKGWTLTCPYPEAMELKFAALGGGYQTRYYTVRGEGIIYAFLKALHESTPQPPPEQAGSVVPELQAMVLLLRTALVKAMNGNLLDNDAQPSATAKFCNAALLSVDTMLSAAPAPKETP